jgi:hypothetical protein
VANKKIIFYLQWVFVIVYALVGLMLLTVPKFKVTFGTIQNLVLGVIFLMYAGYRGYTIFNKLRGENDV